MNELRIERKANMSTATIFEAFGVVRPDGTLEMEQKLAVPPGRVRVRVESMEESETDAEFAARFARLAQEWEDDTKYYSRIDKIVEHPAYQQIIAMGERVVPLLIASLEMPNPAHWFIALHRITGANPVSREDAGRTVKMAAAWIAWGHEKGYRWKRAV
jgi:hypothetical protein